MMDKIEIVRMWGYADEYEIEFVKNIGGLWQTNVPPDLHDGQYAVEIHAMAADGYVCLWTGILYMNNGQHCLHIHDTKYNIWMHLPTTNIYHLSQRSTIDELEKDKHVLLKSKVYSIQLRRCHRHE